MAEQPNSDRVSLEELMVDAKGIITDDEFKAQLGAERANYLALSP